MPATTAEEALEASRYLLRYVPEVSPAESPPPTTFVVTHTTASEGPPAAPAALDTDSLIREVMALIAAHVAGKPLNQVRYDALMAESDRRGIRWAIVGKDKPSGNDPN